MAFERFGEKEQLAGFQPIFLDQMKGVELMNRIDTKFVVSRSVLREILPKLADHYFALEVEGTRMSAYNSQYFDYSNFQLYLDHHNGKGLRHKVRIRKYIESDIYFLEVKKKFKGRTDKKRIAVADFEQELSAGSKEYIQAVIGQPIDLESKLYNAFDRITLVSKTDRERLTLDLNLSYTTNKDTVSFNHIVIAELKQERFNTESPFYRIMKQNMIRPSSFSKYCVGAITLNSDLKYNNFKTKLMLMNKLY